MEDTWLLAILGESIFYIIYFVPFCIPQHEVKDFKICFCVVQDKGRS